MLNVAIIRRKSTPYGGGERVITRIIDGLKRSETAIQINILAEFWENTTHEINPEFHIIKVPITERRKFKKIQSFTDNVKKLLNQHSFDIVQSHERMTGVDICRLGDGLHISWINQLKKTLPWYRRLFLGIDPTHRAILRLEREMMNDEKITFVINNPSMYREIEEHYKIPNSRIYLIENGIDTSKFRKTSHTQKSDAKNTLNIHPNLTTILFLGSSFRRKGAFELVNALKYLKGFQLIIIGEDKHQNKLKKLADKLKISQIVHIMGPQENIQVYLDASDIFCLPSLYEGFSNSLLEAMAS